MRRFLIAFIVAAGVTVAACSGGGSAASAPAGSPLASPVAGGTRIEVKLTDSLRIEPTAIAVPAGVPVTFVVTNTGGTDHEFYLGDETAQAQHEKEMTAMGGMGHDDPAGIAVKPGQTRDLTYTFVQPGETLAGCHVAGHYAAGMRAAITITAIG